MEQVIVDSDAIARKLAVVDQPETTPKCVPPDSEVLGLVLRCRPTGSGGGGASKPYVAGQVVCAEAVVRRTRKETREYEIR